MYIMHVLIDYIHTCICTPHMRLCDCYYVPKHVSIRELVMLYKNVSIN